MAGDALRLMGIIWDFTEHVPIHDWTLKHQVKSKPDEAPAGVRAALESMHTLRDNYPIWFESQLRLWETGAQGFEQHWLKWREDLQSRNPTAHSVLPENGNPMLHQSMLEAA